MALFVEGIAGRPYHIKSLAEHTGEADEPLGEASHDGHSLYFPDAIAYFPDAALNSAMYRLLALDQLGFREFGTYRFDIEVARQQLPQLFHGAPEADGRQSDLGLFFHSFTVPGVARRLFRIIETARVQARVWRRYPGARKYRRALRAYLEQQFEIAQDSDAADQLATLQAALNGLPIHSPLLPLAQAVYAPTADVYTSAAATVACFDALALVAAPSSTAAAGDQDQTMEWLQREARLEDWDDELAKLEGDLATLEFAEQAGEEAQAGQARDADGEQREVGADLVAERDRMKRRIDMERSSVRRALGESRDGAASFRYDEWDFHQGVYLRGWCRLYEEPLQAVTDADSQALLAAVRPFANAVRQRFEQMRPVGYQRVKKTPDGDELDLDAIVQARADIRNGASPDERVYSRRDPIRRDVAAAFLVDLSASTDDIVQEESEPPAPVESQAQDIRDPFFDDDEDYDFAARMAAEAARRRIIDIQREAVLLMATALEGLGDRYGIYGFSGYGRDGVEFYIAKEFDTPFDAGVLDAIAAMKPKRSTRMGPAVRHGTAKLQASGAALKVLMIVSDGFPQDHDYGPNRGEHEYGVQDTAKALAEAHASGIETFCVTVDRSGHDYLRRMCPEERYMVIEETGELPDALQKAYRQLTAT